MCELHGSILRSRCTNLDCESEAFEDFSVPEGVPKCPVCGADLRPDIVLFNEDLPLDSVWPVKRALRDCDLFVAIGTSGEVFPAAGFVRNAKFVGARTVLINLTPMEPKNPDFDEEIIGRAEEILLEWLD